LDDRFSIIIQNMLEFNPYFRASPSKLLRSSLFNGVRTSLAEESAEMKLKMSFDEHGAYDYEKQKPKTYSALMPFDWNSFRKPPKLKVTSD